MIKNNDKISLKQIRVLLIINLFGTASLTMPRYAAEIANVDGWILIVGATLLALLYAYVITKLTRIFPNSTFVEFTEVITNRTIALILSMALFVQLIIAASFELRMFGEIIKQTLLYKTPIEIIILSMLLVCVYSARKGYECRARMGEFFIFLIFIPIVLLIVFAATQVEITNLVPIFVSDANTIVKGSFLLSLKFSILILLLLASTFLADQDRITKTVFTSIGVVGALNLIIFIITVGSFGAEETARNLWPVINMMQVIDIPILFIERQDALMMVFWILTEFTLINAYIFFSSVILQKMMRHNTHRHLVLPLVPIIYFISLATSNVVETFEIMDNIYINLGILFLLPIPLVLLIIAKVRKLGELKDEK